MKQDLRRMIGVLKGEKGDEGEIGVPGWPGRRGQRGRKVNFLFIEI